MERVQGAEEAEEADFAVRLAEWGARGGGRREPHNHPAQEG